MAVAKKSPLSVDEAGITPIALNLDEDARELLVELMRRTGREASEIVGRALGACLREMDGVVLPPQFEEDIDKVLAESEADVVAGRTHSSDEVFGRIAAKHGW